MATKTTDLILNAGINKQAQQDAERGIQRLIDKIADYRKEASDLAADAKAQPLNLAPQLNATADAADNAATSAEQGAKRTLAAYQETADAVKALREEYEQTEQAQQAADSGSAGGGGGGLRVEGLRRTGGALSQLGLGEIGRPISQIGDIAQIGKEAGVLVAALGPLAPVLAVVAAGVAAYTLVLNSYNDRVEANKQNLTRLIEANKAYYEAIENGTQKEIEAKLKAADDKLSIEEKQLAADKALREQAFQDSVKNSGSDFGGRLDISIREGKGEFKALDDEIKALTDSVNTDKGSVEGLRKAYDEESVRRRTIVADAEKDADTRIQQEKDRAQADKDMAALLKSGTDAIHERITSIANEREAIGQSIKNLSDTIKLAGGDPGSNEKVKELTRQFDELGKQEDTLTKVTLPAIENLNTLKEKIAALGQYAKLTNERQALLDEAAKVAKERAYTAEKDALAKDYDARIEVAKAVEKEADNQKRLTAIIEQEQAKETDLKKKFIEQQQKDIEQYNASVDKLTTNYQDSQLKSQRNFQRQEQQSDERYARERQKSLEDLAFNLSELARQGDVAGFLSAQRAGLRSIGALDENNAQGKADRLQAFKDQQDDAKSNYDKQLDDLKKSFDQQEKERAKTYREQLATLREEARVRLQEERAAQEAGIKQSVQLEQEYRDKLKALQDKHNQEAIDAQDEAFQVQFGKLNDALQQQQTAYDNFWEGTKQTAKNALDVLLSKAGLQFTPNAGGLLGGLFGGGSNILNSVTGGSSNAMNVGQINIGSNNAVTKADVLSAFDQFAAQIKTALQAGATA